MNAEEIKAHQRAFLDSVKSRIEPITYDVEGIDITVNPGVFPPATDTKLLASHIHVQPGVRTLDVTSGAGTFSVIAGLQGASGVAVDINPAAVRNSEENFKKYGVDMLAIKSDLFENVPDESFNYIYANGPFFEGDISDPLDYACYGAISFIERLLKELHSRLKPDGELLIVLSAMSDLKHFNKTLTSNNLDSSLIHMRLSDDGQRQYNLYSVKLV